MGLKMLRTWALNSWVSSSIEGSSFREKVVAGNRTVVKCLEDGCVRFARQSLCALVACEVRAEPIPCNANSTVILEKGGDTESTRRNQCFVPRTPNSTVLVH